MHMFTLTHIQQIHIQVTVTPAVVVAVLQWATWWQLSLSLHWVEHVNNLKVIHVNEHVDIWCLDRSKYKGNANW